MSTTSPSVVDGEKMLPFLTRCGLLCLLLALLRLYTHMHDIRQSKGLEDENPQSLQDYFDSVLLFVGVQNLSMNVMQFLSVMFLFTSYYRRELAEVLDVLGFEGAAAWVSESYGVSAGPEQDLTDLPPLCDDSGGIERIEPAIPVPASPVAWRVESPPPRPPTPQPVPDSFLVFHPQLGLVPKHVRCVRARRFLAFLSHTELSFAVTPGLLRQRTHNCPGLFLSSTLV